MITDIKRITKLENDLHQLDKAYFIRKGFTLGVKSIKPCKCVKTFSQFERDSFIMLENNCPEKNCFKLGQKPVPHNVSYQPPLECLNFKLKKECDKC